MTNTKIYKKVGRRYKEIGACEHESIFYPHGSHLVVCAKGSTLTRYNIERRDAALEAALQNARDAMAAAMHEATKMQPEKRAYTKNELAGFEAYKAIAGDMQGLRFEGVSMAAVVESAITVLRAEMEALA